MIYNDRGKIPTPLTPFRSNWSFLVCRSPTVAVSNLGPSDLGLVCKDS